jgi:hypothetical protein
MFPVSLDCFNLEKLETLGTQDEDKHYKNNLEKLETLGTQYEDKHYKNNLEKLETMGTQDEDKHYKNNLEKLVYCVPNVSSFSRLFL